MRRWPSTLESTEAAIPEYWVVDVRGRRILRHAEPGSEGYAVGLLELGPDDELRSTAVPTLTPLLVRDVLEGELPERP